MRPSALILISLAPIYAAMVDITAGASPVTIANIGNAKFRFSQANFDQSLGYGSGTPNGSTFVSRDLGNNTVLGQRTYQPAMDGKRADQRSHADGSVQCDRDRCPCESGERNAKLFQYSFHGQCPADGGVCERDDREWHRPGAMAGFR